MSILYRLFVSTVKWIFYLRNLGNQTFCNDNIFVIVIVKGSSVRINNFLNKLKSHYLQYQLQYG